MPKWTWIARRLPKEDGREAFYAVHDLAGLGRPAVGVLAGALGDPNPHLRRNAADALGMIGPAAWATAPALARLLTDPDVSVRIAAATGLARVDPGRARAAVDVLVRAAEDAGGGDAFLGRMAAVWALGDLGRAARPALPALRSVVVGGTEDVLGRFAADAIKRIEAAGRTAEQVAFAKDHAKDVTARLGEREFLRANPGAVRDPQDSNPRAGLVTYSGLLATHSFLDGVLISASVTIPRTEDTFGEHHARTMAGLGPPDLDLLDAALRRDGVTHNYAWWMTECDLLVNYVVRRRGREYHQIITVGSIKGLDTVAERSK